ncbi:hypothetical protein AB0M61_01830 [Streptomyces sp. NPDC051642]|uniref:hypothetical protein n=1 Tax=Streptomyces sp. NPDC051642 TaxID=3154646 RepID=UPI0034286EB7
MASDQGIEIAKDGIAEVAMTKARAALTSLIREVRWGGRPGAFTERKERVAFVVAPAFYEQALRDRELIEALKTRAQAPPADAKADERLKSRTLREALSAAERDVAAARNIAES